MHYGSVSSYAKAKSFGSCGSGSGAGSGFTTLLLKGTWVYYIDLLHLILLLFLFSSIFDGFLVVVGFGPPPVTSQWPFSLSLSSLCSAGRGLADISRTG
jgi:hypothetical protein